TTSGFGSPGVFATSNALGGTGNAYAFTYVGNSGTITTHGNSSQGVLAYASALSSGTSTANILINNSGTIRTTGSFSNAVDATVVYGAGTIVLNNSGTIFAQGFPYHAVVTSGAPTTINNSGLLQGNVQLSAFNDTLNNSGTWVMQGDSNFFGGNDAVNNSGTVTMVNTAGGYTVSVIGLENFYNKGGLVTMVNGAPNQQIVLSGNFNASG